MPNLIIIHQNSTQINRISTALTKLKDWHLFFIDTSADHPGSFPKDIEVHFIVFVQNIENIYSNAILNIPLRDPQIIKIYYASYLKNAQFVKIYENGINCCIVGESRDKHLIDLLQQMWLQHWKRIPETLKARNGSKHSARAKKIIQYIENKPLNCANVADLARYLNLSQGYFREEFRRIFDMSFREFKKALISHYESILLFKKRLKPVEIYDLLNYKNLSAFSRSFKLNYGKRWRDIAKEFKQLPLS